MWKRMPLLWRALRSAMAVTGTATVVWGVLVQSNLQFSPKLPWAAVVMAAFLIFYWKFLSGWGWPKSTAAPRRTGLRAERLTSSVWRWSLLAGRLPPDPVHPLVLLRPLLTPILTPRPS